MNASKLKVRKGENVRAAWDRLVLWVESLKIVPHPDITFRHTPHGVIVRVKRRDRWLHPWRVGVDSATASVSTGTINGIVPNIREKGVLRRIDNRDKSGKYLTDKDAPVLKVDPSKASKEGTFFISLKVKPSASAEAFATQTDEVTKEMTSDALEIVQTDSAGGPKDGHSYYPLAMVYLSTDRKSVSESFQIAHHNLRYTFQERDATADELKTDPATKKIGRGVFYPV